MYSVYAVIYKSCSACNYVSWALFSKSMCVSELWENEIDVSGFRGVGKGIVSAEGHVAQLQVVYIPSIGFP